MKRIFLIIICLLCSSAFAVVGDFTADGCVDYNDLAIFADSWLYSDPNIPDPNTDLDSDGTVNFADFAMLAENWNNCGNIIVPPPADNNEPTAKDINDVWAYTYIVKPITLVATDDDLPNPPARLKYVITDLPNDVNAYIQDPVSGGQVKIKAENLPYKLSSWGDTVWFATSTVGTTSFKFKAWDGEQYSNEATVDVNVMAYINDCLSFDGSGYITFVDNVKYDLADGWAVDFWINTRQPFATLFRKIDGNGSGYEIKTVSGKIQFDLYDTGTRIITARAAVRIDTGSWNEISVIFNHKSAVGIIVNITTGLGVDDGFGGYSVGDDTEYFVFADYKDIGVSYANTANLIAGSGFKYTLDKIRFFSGVAYPQGMGHIIIGLSARTESIDEQILGIGKISDVLYMLDEGTGTTITDMKLGLTGTLSDSNHVRWYPFNWHWADLSVQQYYWRMTK